MSADVAATLEQALLSQGIAASALLEGAEFLDAEAGFRAIRFYKCFGRAARRVGRKSVEFDAKLTAELSGIYPGFTGSDWPLSTLARLWLLLQVPEGQRGLVLDRLFEHAELEELVTLYRGLYLLPGRENFGEQVAEGLRSNMVDVFEAVALRNPLPALVLDDRGWMQMVLKAVFMERPLYSIYGIDERASLELAEKASDYAHERWAAGRRVTPELWRLLAGFDHPQLRRDLERAAQLEDPLTHRAASLAIGSSARAAGKAWAELGAEYEQQTRGQGQGKIEVLYPVPPARQP